MLLPQLRLNKTRGTYYIAFMAIISFPSLGDRSEAALFCLEVFLHFFGFNFGAGLTIDTLRMHKGIALRTLLMMMAAPATDSSRMFAFVVKLLM